MFEISQTHVVKAKKEGKHTPRVIVHSELELLFTPADDGDCRRRRLGGSSLSSNEEEAPSFSSRKRAMSTPLVPAAAAAAAQIIEFLGMVHLMMGDDPAPVLDYSAQRLVDSFLGSVFSLSGAVSNVDIIVDLDLPRIVREVSMLLQGDTMASSAKVGLHHNDGQNQEEEEKFLLPDFNWLWFDIICTSSCQVF